MDAYLALSNLRLIRARIPEAKEALQKLKIVIENCGTENFPSCDFLSQACKNAIECEDFEILEFFTEVGLSIDESNTELSYLRGFALAKLGFKDEALDTLNQLLAKNISPELKEAAEEIILTLD
jgi:tetratricopeptide (TPR) repeat protein